MAGLEPANPGVKVPCLDQLGYIPVYDAAEEKIRSKRSGSFPFTSLGWVKGLEPSTPGTTIRCSNQLSYTHHTEEPSKKGGTPGGTRTPGPLLRRQLLYPTELQARIWMEKASRRKASHGAGDGNRTHVASLEGWSSTIELRPRGIHSTRSQPDYITTIAPVCQSFSQIFFPSQRLSRC